jgi:hypothetical protein
MANDRGCEGKGPMGVSGSVVDTTVRLIAGVAILGAIAGCSHAVRVNTPTVTSINAQVPFAVDVVISPEVSSFVAHPSTYAGVVKHTFDVPLGEPLADTLKRVAHAAFREVTVIATPTGDRPVLSLELSGSPVVNVQWEQGLFLVGQRTDCHIAIEARLLSETNEQIWQTVAMGDGQHETGRVANWPTAAQAEPAVSQAIQAVGTALLQRLTTGREIVQYHPRTIAIVNSGSDRSAPSASQHRPGSDASQRLSELEQLRGEGLITDAEYRGKRERILRGL